MEPFRKLLGIAIIEKRMGRVVPLLKNFEALNIFMDEDTVADYFNRPASILL